MLLMVRGIRRGTGVTAPGAPAASGRQAVRRLTGLPGSPAAQRDRAAEGAGGRADSGRPEAGTGAPRHRRLSHAGRRALVYAACLRAGRGVLLWHGGQGGRGVAVRRASMIAAGLVLAAD